VGFKVTPLIFLLEYIARFQLPAVGFKERRIKVFNIKRALFQLPAVGFKDQLLCLNPNYHQCFSFQQWDLKSFVWYVIGTSELGFSFQQWDLKVSPPFPSIPKQRKFQLPAVGFKGNYL